MYRTRRHFGAGAPEKSTLPSSITRLVNEGLEVMTETPLRECNSYTEQLFQRLETIINGCDPSKSGANTYWYYEGQDPLTGWWFTNIPKKEGDSKSTDDNLLSSFIHGARATSRMAKWLAGLNLVSNIGVWMRGLPCQNPTGQPNYIRDKIKWANDILDRFEVGNFCVSADLFCANGNPEILALFASVKDRNDAVATRSDGEPYLRNCRGLVDWATTDQRVNDYYYSVPSIKKGVRRRVTVRSRLASLRSCAYDIEASIGDGKMQGALFAARAEINAANRLVAYEQEYEVEADFKVNLLRPFMEIAEEAITETVTRPDYEIPVIDPTILDENDYSGLLKIAAGIIGLSAGVVVGKKVAEKMR
jgi:hypothetical protein